MASANIRFEVVISFPQTSAASAAISTFYTNLAALTPVYQYVVNDPNGNILEVVFGYITAAQATSALAALATLNASAAGPVIANQWASTSEP